MKLLMTALALLSLSSFGQEAPKKQGNIIYEYKKFESFDLGDLSVQGEVIAPGDLSVKQRQRTKLRLDLYDRQDFDDKIARDVNNLR